MSRTVTLPRPAANDGGHPRTRRPARLAPSRRVSGPAAGRAATFSSPRPRSRQAPRETLALGARALALVRGLPEHSLIDRLVRGRAWIPVLGVLLAGIVATQVEILKLGTSMGRAMERSSVLQTQNESLQASVASLADDQRIERLAAGMGMVMSGPNSLVFRSARPSADVGRAIGNIHTPDPSGFLSQLAAEAAAAAALSPNPPSGVPGSSTSSTLPGTGTSTGTAGPVSPVVNSPATGSSAQTTSTQVAGPATPTPSPSAGGTSPATGTATPTPSSSAGGTSPATGAAGVAPAGLPQSSAGGGG